MNKRASFVLIVALVSLTLALSGCGEEVNTVNNYPMITGEFEGGPWQIVTYGDDKIYHEKVVLGDEGVSTQSYTVYINNKSQFIYLDGTPITTYEGHKIYWNNDGQIINRYSQVIPEDQIFVVNDKPMPINTAIRLRDYNKQARDITLAGIGEGG